MGGNMCLFFYISYWVHYIWKGHIVNVDVLQSMAEVALYYFIWKESLNSDGQLFHQYPQNERPPQIIEHKKKTMTYTFILWS
jgi:hypothetical protein